MGATVEEAGDTRQLLGRNGKWVYAKYLGLRLLLSGVRSCWTWIYINNELDDDNTADIRVKSDLNMDCIRRHRQGYLVACKTLLCESVTFTVQSHAKYFFGKLSLKKEKIIYAPKVIH